MECFYIFVILKSKVNEEIDFVKNQIGTFRNKLNKSNLRKWNYEIQ